MDGFLARYVGYDIEVLYLTDNNTFRDRGRLSGFGDGWIELIKDEALFLVPTTAIRLLKVISSSQEPAQILLRSSAPPADRRTTGDQ